MVDQRLIISDIDRFIKELFTNAIKASASDIHIQAEDGFGKIRLRVDGKLKDFLILKRENYERLISKLKVLSDMDLAEKRLPQDRAMTLPYFDGIDFRLSSIDTVAGEKIVVRILSIDEFFKRSNLLGFSKNSKDKLKKAISDRSGMVLISGPTGSGKSTSLYALIKKLNKEEVNIISIEDPVEYKIENINQISINEKIGLTYPVVLRSILRQDPDIIMVGEIRDSETASIAVRAAITGHLVLATVHTQDALSILIRLKDLGVEDYLIRSSVSALVGQRLIRSLCSCKIESTMTDREYELVSKYIRVARDRKIYRPGGCENCTDGYKGRQAIEEVILVDGELRQILKNEGLESKELRDKLKKDKFRPMVTNGLIAVLEGRTSFEEVLSVLEV